MSGFWRHLQQADRRILIIFLSLLAIVFSLLISFLVVSRHSSFLPAVTTLLSGLIIVFFGTGIVIYRHQALEGMLTHRAIARVVVFIAWPLALVVVASIMINSPATPGLPPVTFFGLFAIIFAASLIALIVLGYAFIFVGLGVIGIMVVVMSGGVPDLLITLRGITAATSTASCASTVGTVGTVGTGSNCSNCSEDGGRSHQRPAPRSSRNERLKALALRWFFDIPAVLDTRTITLTPPQPRSGFPMREFGIAVAWELFFGSVIGINLTLNPILLETFAFDQLFALASNLSIVMPILVLPWFLFRYLDVRIAGPVGQYRLATGLRKRLFGMLVAVGTLILILRLALKRFQPAQLLARFSGYLLGFALVCVVFTFIYFNYFEPQLAAATYERFRQARDPTTGQAGAEPKETKETKETEQPPTNRRQQRTMDPMLSRRPNRERMS